MVNLKEILEDMEHEVIVFSENDRDTVNRWNEELKEIRTALIKMSFNTPMGSVNSSNLNKIIGK